MNLVQVAHHIDPKALELVRELAVVAAGVVILCTVVLALSRRK